MASACATGGRSMTVAARKVLVRKLAHRMRAARKCPLSVVASLMILSPELQAGMW